MKTGGQLIQGNSKNGYFFYFEMRSRLVLGKIRQVFYVKKSRLWKTDIYFTNPNSKSNFIEFVKKRNISIDIEYDAVFTRKLFLKQIAKCFIKPVERLFNFPLLSGNSIDKKDQLRRCLHDAG